MKIIFILLLAISLQADECIKCEEAIDDMIEAKFRETYRTVIETKL